MRPLFLLIGHAEDPAIRLVSHELRRRGADVSLTAAPLAEPHAMRWWIDDAAGDALLRGRPERRVDQPAGVLVRGHGGPVDATGWDPRDLEYARTETQAALIAWLWSLSCPVVNRPSADLWFRPNLSYAEWHAAFQRCGLPVSPLCYTNRIDAAREFAQRWHGRAIYLPFTSPSRYPISSARDWDELARLAARFPVCVTAPAERSVHATVVGESVVWGGCDGALDVGVLEPGLLRLADSLDLDFVQIEIALTADGLRCICATPHPLLERHPDGEQVLADELVRLLERGSRRMRPGPPELRRLACPQGPP